MRFVTTTRFFVLAVFAAACGSFEPTGSSGQGLATMEGSGSAVIVDDDAGIEAGGSDGGLTTPADAWAVVGSDGGISGSGSNGSGSNGSGSNGSGSNGSGSDGSGSNGSGSNGSGSDGSGSNGSGSNGSGSDGSGSNGSGSNGSGSDGSGSNGSGSDGSGSNCADCGSDGSGSDGSGSDGSGSDGSGSDCDGSDCGSGSATCDAGDCGSDGSGSDICIGDDCGSDGSGSDGSGSGSCTADGGSGSGFTDPDLEHALDCVAQLSDARSQYLASLQSAAAGYPQPPVTPGDGTASPADVVLVAAALAAGPDGGALFGFPDPAASAIFKLASFEDSFYSDIVLTNYPLLSCTGYLSLLPMQSGYFGSGYDDSGGGSDVASGPDGGSGSAVNACGGGVNAAPVEPGINCMGIVAVASISYVNGALNQDDTAKCADYDKPIAQTNASGLTGPTAVASGGSRKDAMQSKKGDNCAQASPLLQNWDMGIAVKPAGVFIPDQILVDKAGTLQWQANDAKMLYYVYPGADGKPVKKGPKCRNNTELTVRTTANMSMPYYLWAAVMNDKNGYSGGSDAYQSLAEVDQKCYGPGTNVTNPNSFSIVASENETKSSLKVVKDCTGEVAWNGNVSVGGTMGKDPGGSVGFSGGITTTERCAKNRDIDNFASGGCFANQNFGNVALTTKKQNGPFAIGSVFQLFNPNDPVVATAPVNFLVMGMQLISAQVRITSSISTDMAGVGGSAFASMLTTRKKPTDKPAAVNGQLKMGSPGCALLVDGTPRPATECVVPLADWPWIPKGASTKTPSAQDMTDRFNLLIKQITDAAAR